MKKTAKVGLLSGILMLTISLLTSTLFQFILPSLGKEYTNTSIFRPWSDPLMSLMFIQPIIVGFILAWIWSHVKYAVKGDNTTRKGINFGLAYWITTLPGMLISYGTFNISIFMVVAWSITILLQAIPAGIYISKKIV